MTRSDREMSWTIVQRSKMSGPGPTGAHVLYSRGGEGAAKSRDRIDVPAGAVLSLGTYFGAFPAGVWRRTTGIDAIRLSFALGDAATVRVMGTDGKGRVATLAEYLSDRGEVALDIPLTDDLSWLWLELDGGAHGATIGAVTWSVHGVDAPPGALAVCITTFNREADCVRLLERLSSEPEVLRGIGRVIVVDQGTRPLLEHPGFAAAAERLEGRVNLVRQANLGGSGGFSRGMLLAAAGPEEWALLLDDDVDLEPESILRMIALARCAPEPVIVGAHMLSLLEPTVVHSWGERVDRRRFWWTAVDPDLAPVDLAVSALERTPALSVQHTVDFNGWWMCLIPTETVRQIGASLPYFIKWDDAEYGLRAIAAGVATITLPGAALWHMPWTGKDNTLDWQVYFHLRNRLVTALIHGRGHGAFRVLTSTFAQDVNHLLCLQYGSVRARHLALHDVLKGPSHLPESIANRRSDVLDVLELSGQLTTETMPATLAETQAPRRGISGLVRVALHQLRSSPREAGVLQTAVPSAEGKWWRLGLLDSAALASADGRAWFVLRRNRRAAFRLLVESIGLHVRLLVRWRRLAGAYRSAAPTLASDQTWGDIFAT